MARVLLENVVKRYGDVLAVDRLSLECQDGEFLALLGPSGCGKTSTMRMIAGLEEVTEGSIFIGERRVNDLAPAERNVAMAFENYGLYPHRTVFANIAYPLRIRGAPRETIAKEVVRVARLLRIEGLLDQRPLELSGGAQQRVSLARALVRKPTVFLMDEPISHLDAELRGQMRGELRRLHEVDRSTTIYVTHDQLEALSMADRVAVMNRGVLQQLGRPHEMLRRPGNRFVATFVGEPPMNIVTAAVNRRGEEVITAVDGFDFMEVPAALREGVLRAAEPAGRRIEVGVRPDDFEVDDAGSRGLPGTVRVREVLGESALVTVDVPGHKLRLRLGSGAGPVEGERVVIRPRRERTHFFDAVSGIAIGDQDRPSEE